MSDLHQLEQSFEKFISLLLEEAQETSDSSDTILVAESIEKYAAEMQILQKIETGQLAMAKLLFDQLMFIMETKSSVHALISEVVALTSEHSDLEVADLLRQSNPWDQVEKKLSDTLARTKEQL